MINRNEKLVITECLIDGKKVLYGVCSKSPLKEAKAFYKKTLFKKYIGSSHVLYFNGKKNTMKELYHFFTK